MNYEEILNLIPYGRENAIGRTELRELANMKDRQVRKCIQDARNAGEFVGNLQNGNGYFRFNAEDLDDVEAQFNLNLARMKSLSVQQKPLRKLLKEAGRL